MPLASPKSAAAALSAGAPLSSAQMVRVPSVEPPGAASLPEAAGALDSPPEVAASLEPAAPVEDSAGADDAALVVAAGAAVDDAGVFELDPHAVSSSMERAATAVVALETCTLMVVGSSAQSSGRA